MFMNIIFMWNYVQAHSPDETWYYIKPCVTEFGQCNYLWSV